VHTGSERRFVGGADPLPVNGPDEDETQRWNADPVWQATNIAPGAELAEAKAAAEWPVSRLTSWSPRQGQGPTVRDLIPDDFDAYVRILFHIFEPADNRSYVEELFTWHETALRNGRQRSGGRRARRSRLGGHGYGQPAHTRIETGPIPRPWAASRWRSIGNLLSRSAACWDTGPVAEDVDASTRARQVWERLIRKPWMNPEADFDLVMSKLAIEHSVEELLVSQEWVARSRKMHP
jgi:hypothetical protein